jgi:hypothetical protein
VKRGERTNQRLVEGVGAGGGKPGSNARVWRSFDIDQHGDVEPAERGHEGSTTTIMRRADSSGGAAWSSVGGVIRRISRRRKPGTEGLNNFRTPAGNWIPTIATVLCPTATHFHYAHLILECEPG